MIGDDVIDGGDQRSSSDQRSPEYFLVELTSLDDLSFPASTSKRVKFTCVNVSPRSLVLGTSSGTVYSFSRFRQKTRVASPSNLPPVDVFVTKDGAVNTVLVSPSEQLIAVGSDSGRVSVAAIAVNGQPTSILYTVPGDARNPDRVTCLVWTADSKSLIVGHASGLVHMHKLASRSVFRSAHEDLLRLDSEIVQIDLRENRLLISTMNASHVYDMEQGNTYQVGKKARNSRMGACYLTTRDAARDAAAANGDSDFIVAARPNGRMWEANSVGVVYRTHQFRQATLVPRCSPVSYRASFKGAQSGDDGAGLETAVNLDVNLALLNRLQVNDDVFLVTWSGSRILLLDVESSQIVLLSDLKEDISCVSVCGSDVFVLLAGSSALRKFTVFPRRKAVEKLQLRGCHLQAAQLILFTSPDVRWPDDVIRKTADALAGTSGSRRKLHPRSDGKVGRRERENDKLRAKLYELAEREQSMYDNCVERKAAASPLATSRATPLASQILPSGVHRVRAAVALRQSGYEDDFEFELPTELRRAKSRSDPAVETSPLPLLSKQSSLPLTEAEVDGKKRNGTPDVTRHDILNRARQILESDGHVMGADSLRTLLQLEGPQMDDVTFVHTVTVSNVAKALAELALTTPEFPDELTVDRKSSGRKRTGPTIVKTVRPRKAPPPATTSPRQIEMVSTLVTRGGSTNTADVRDADDERENNSNLIEDDVIISPIKTLTSSPLVNDAENNMEVAAGIQSRMETDWIAARLDAINREQEVAASPPRSLPHATSRASVSTESATTTAESVNGDQSTPIRGTTENGPERDRKYGKDNCEQCGVHRSWVGVALLSSVCRRVEVKRSSPEMGSIPRTAAEWSQLLSRRLAPSSQSTLSRLDRHAPCPRCEMGIASATKVLAGLSTSTGLFPDGSRIPCERIRERIAGSDEDRMKRALFGGKGSTTTMKQEEGEEITSASLLPSGSDRPVPVAKPVDDVTDGVCISDSDDSNPFDWKHGVDVKTLLFLCYLVLGHRELLDLIRNSPEILDNLSGDDWTTLVALTVEENTRRKNTVSGKVVQDVLNTVHLSDWLSLGPAPSTVVPGSSTVVPSSPRGSLSRRQPPPIYSWVVDCNGFCPICTLPLQTTVNGEALLVTSFNCGHAYHTQCLSGRAYCVACRVRARKAAGVGANGVTGANRVRRA